MADHDADAAKEGQSGEGAEKAAGAPAAGGGGMSAWMPLILTLVATPGLAFAATKFLIVPQIQKALGHGAGAAAHGTEGDAHGEEAHAEAEASDHGGGGGHGSSGGGGHGASGGGAAAGNKFNVTMNKIIVNVAGTMGTRYLMASLTLVGGNASFKNKFEANKDQLLDVATSALSAKSIADLEKPGARNQIRTELITVFNTVLGDSAVREIYITEFNIQ